MPEAAEGVWTTTFFSNLLVDVLGKEVLPSPPEVSSSHHALKPKLAEEEKLICFQKFQTKDVVNLLPTGSEAYPSMKARQSTYTKITALKCWTGVQSTKK